MSDTNEIETQPAQITGGGWRPSEAQLAAVVEAAYILDAVRR
jgi:hypothetical protein